MRQASAESTGNHSRKVLVCDDEQGICYVLTQYFALKGYEVRAVNRGEEALALVDVFHPNVVLLDLLMPGMTGVETLKDLKQHHPAIRIIMLSAADDQDVAHGAISLGADSYVCKPPNLSHLEHLVKGFWPADGPPQ